MLKLYYTGSIGLNQPQLDPIRSVGGCKSLSEVPNGSLNQIFQSISYIAQRDELIECRGLVLVNEGTDIADLYCYFNYPDSVNYSRLSIGIESLDTNFAIQRLSRVDALPNGVDFYEANSVLNKILVAASIVQNGAIGIWLQRQAFPNPNNSVADIALESYLLNLKKQETVQLVFSY